MRSRPFLSLIPFPFLCSPEANTVMLWCVPKSVSASSTAQVFIQAQIVWAFCSVFKIYFNTVRLYLLTTFCF